MASLISRFGDAVLSIAALWAVYVFTHSAIWLGVIVLAEVAPMILFSLYSGVIVDRLNQKKIMIFADIARFITLIALVLIWRTHFHPLAVLYVGLFMVSGFSALFRPGLQVLTKRIVSQDNLLASSAWIQSGRSVADLIGLAAGGAIISATGRNLAFFIDALTFMTSALLLSGIPFAQPERKTSNDPVKKDLAAAIRYLANSSRELKQAFWYIVIINFAISPLSILMTLRAGHSGIHVLGLSMFSVALAGGSLLGAQIADWVRRRVTAIEGILASVSLFAVCSVIGAIAPSLWAVSLALIGAGIGSSVTLVLVNFLFQTQTDTRFLGRIGSFRQLALRIPPPVMAFVYGFLISRAGIVFSTICIEVATIALSVLVFQRYKGGENGVHSASNWRN